MQRSSVLALLVAGLAALAACGNDGSSDDSASTPARTATEPQLATRPAAAGEIVVRGESSPAIHGPFAFEGRYLVRYEQYAPEDADLDFSSQVPFEAALTRREGDPRGAVALVEPAAARNGRRELAIDGRFYVDVSFGDFPYVLRFTPRDSS